MNALRAPTIADDAPQVTTGPSELVAAPTPAPPRRSARPSRTKAILACLGWAFVGITGFVALWALISWRTPDLPGPAKAWASLSELLADPFASAETGSPGIGVQLGTSLGRTLKGFTLAALIGIPLGLLIGGSRRAWQAVNPVVQLLRPVSPLAWFPIGLVVLKDSPGAAVFVIFVTALWPMVVNTAAGAASVPVDQRNVSRVFRFGRATYVRQVMIPHSVPSIITGLRLSMGVAWMVIVAVEMLSGGSGIGFFVWDSYNGGNLAAVMAAIIIIGTVGVALDSVFVSLGRHYSGETMR